MSRVELIKREVIEAMGDIADDILELPLEQWFTDAPQDETNAHRPFGYVLPWEDECWRFAYAPELIDLQTCELDDDDFAHYLDALLLHVHFHLIHRDRRCSVSELERFVDSLLYDTAPPSMALLSRVQMDALSKMG